MMGDVWVNFTRCFSFFLTKVYPRLAIILISISHPPWLFLYRMPLVWCYKMPPPTTFS
jgi:hypothetical protein